MLATEPYGLPLMRLWRFYHPVCPRQETWNHFVTQSDNSVLLDHSYFHQEYSTVSRTKEFDIWEKRTIKFAVRTSLVCEFWSISNPEKEWLNIDFDGFKELRSVWARRRFIFLFLLLGGRKGKVTICLIETTIDRYARSTIVSPVKRRLIIINYSSRIRILNIRGDPVALVL